MTNKKYTESDIKVLDDQQHVLQRPNVYVGSLTEEEYAIPAFGESFDIVQSKFIPGLAKIIFEILDNSVDEHAQSGLRGKRMINITADNESTTYTISDNGRGVPIGKHESGKYTPEVVFASLRSGRNFTNDKAAGVIGQNGLGSSLCNVLSESFEVTINRDGKEYYQKFEDSLKVIHPPIIKKSNSKKTGTSISFKVQPDFFTTNTLPEEIIRERANIIAATNPNVVVSYNDEIFMYKNGLSDLLGKYFDDLHKFSNEKIEFFVTKNHSSSNSSIFTWVNSSMLYDGGICNTQLINAFVDKTISHLEREAKKRKVTINRNDVLENTLFFASLIVSDPSYDSQAKTKLTGPNLRKDIDAIITDGWKDYVKNNKTWFDEVIERAIRRSNISATKEATKNQQKGKRIKIDGFMDAENKKRDQCQLLITEGKSAASNIVQSRDPKTTASLALTGKINNVYGSSVAEVLKMGKVTDMLTAIGLVPGKRAMRSELRYNRCIISCDADFDGNHITTLLVNLFYQFWPELFDPKYPPFFYRMVAPNIVAEKGKKRIHIPNREEFEANKGKYKGYQITYMKGLGSMSKIDWDMILRGTTDVFEPIQDDGEMADALKLMFGPDADARKEWLQK